MVTALKLSATPSFSRACNARRRDGASVKTNDSMVAMSGAIMPAPLAMPLIVTLALPILAVAVATLGKVSVVMMARAASRKSPGRARSVRPCITGVEFAGIERLADHAGGGQEDFRRLAAGRLGGDLGGELGRRRGRSCR